MLNSNKTHQGKNILVESTLKDSLSSYKFDFEFSNLEINNLRMCVKDVYIFPDHINEQDNMVSFFIVQETEKCVSLIREHFGLKVVMDALGFEHDIEFESAPELVGTFDVSSMSDIEKSTRELIELYESSL